MQLLNINFQVLDDEDGANTYPKTVTVEMSIEEAIWVAKLAGQQRGESPHNGIYNSLIGDVMNRYWDDGVDGAMKMLGPITTPPIRYDD